MKEWTFEPGHTGAEFCVRHMMVTNVRGHFKNIRGALHFDPDKPADSYVKATCDAAGLWSGEKDRDEHLRSSDFLDVQNHPTITFESERVELIGANEAKVTGKITIRGITRPLTLDARYLGQWQTPWWEDGVDKGPKTRAGFLATGKLNRQDFGVKWNSPLDRGGIVVGNEVVITIDAEAILNQ
jgi:polyisoprenoid-binding protein YceI